ncbi:polyketide cyclase/dehydrase/lipid transport protein [Murinocardiopsis flavida]|uniref:Polyketide cyclase/dehydrase/lipid transport protein n=1 Tax=Murinocardiopsis flavida TaxID=645275 RepID=A0A2P8DRS6_9ACTN|nr:SRPBCC family protein [Murinocardiopsis flavida]PSK99923.1 polyketide cyclase/dehydrase/lipid transport protein [Murinocardiopsis flavida]
MPVPETVPDDVTRAVLDGPPDKVFDLLTQGRWWKEWHVSSTGVGGVTERPYLLGDLVQETGEVNGQHFTLSWRVVEHVRPSRVVLHEENLDAYLVYAFEEDADGRTRYSRASHLDNADRLRGLGHDPEALRRDTAAASAASITRLEDHINGILAAEHRDMHAG